MTLVLVPSSRHVQMVGPPNPAPGRTDPHADACRRGFTHRGRQGKCGLMSAEDAQQRAFHRVSPGSFLLGLEAGHQLY